MALSKPAAEMSRPTFPPHAHAHIPPAAEKVPLDHIPSHAQDHIPFLDQPTMTYSSHSRTYPSGPVILPATLFRLGTTGSFGQIGGKSTMRSC